ncbi:hypothetical protein [Maridesulfovibrio hydrothermalis]|uniref:Lipoprotein n=1 Tax=Maridesulfovibrio hydrothermalis AM13 = DSM 14728 TaxID=1121451 RepID=L0R9Z0_9BACT|nr:hypothetical protein [Maridesulfovibrio hydrothermalis]CCO22995.1 conserved exported protein of unknown function [Maridesulfovibrio hydrothermalis AM13 = DSM 14728]
MKRSQLILSLLILVSFVFFAGCTQETQNRIGRSIQNWTGVAGVLEVYSGGKLVKRFIKIDKLSTASGTSERIERPYRFGYGVLDSNLNGKADPNEKKVYFEFSDYSTNYVFFENPNVKK